MRTRSKVMFGSLAIILILWVVLYIFLPDYTYLGLILIGVFNFTIMFKERLFLHNRNLTIGTYVKFSRQPNLESVEYGIINEVEFDGGVITYHVSNPMKSMKDSIHIKWYDKPEYADNIEAVTEPEYIVGSIL
tara:strand:- start:2311 stop:2709 length:399 start_codon:yes stop_codon:yes gene_type:complete